MLAHVDRQRNSFVLQEAPHRSLPAPLWASGKRVRWRGCPRTTPTRLAGAAPGRNKSPADGAGQRFRDVVLLAREPAGRIRPFDGSLAKRSPQIDPAWLGCYSLGACRRQKKPPLSWGHRARLVLAGVVRVGQPVGLSTRRTLAQARDHRDVDRLMVRRGALVGLNTRRMPDLAYHLLSCLRVSTGRESAPQRIGIRRFARSSSQ